MHNSGKVIVVTRHLALVAYLKERGYITDDTPVYAHAKAEDIRDAHVIGKVSMHLAAQARTVTEVPLQLEVGDRGKELPLERLRQIALPPQVFQVLRVDDHTQVEEPVERGVDQCQSRTTRPQFRPRRRRGSSRPTAA